MNFEDEKDYIMRVIKEMVRVLFSMLFGKKFVSVELEDENKYEVSGKKLTAFKEMVDQGLINEAEILLLAGIDYPQINEIAAATLFYQNLGEKEDDFLLQHGYSREEVLDGIRQLLQNAGYGDLAEIMNSTL